MRQAGSEQQFGFMLRKSSADVMFAFRVLMEKFREAQKQLRCVFVDLEKTDDGEKLCCCTRKPRAK